MPFDWSLNPYMGCAHRCTFCYVRAFERRADRPADDRYGRSIRVKVNVADVPSLEETVSVESNSRFWVEAATVMGGGGSGSDRVYVGYNGPTVPSGRTAGALRASPLASSRTRASRRTIVFRLRPRSAAISSWVMSSM